MGICSINMWAGSWKPELAAPPPVHRVTNVNTSGLKRKRVKRFISPTDKHACSYRWCRLDKWLFSSKDQLFLGQMCKVALTSQVRWPSFLVLPFKFLSPLSPCALSWWGISFHSYLLVSLVRQLGIISIWLMRCLQLDCTFKTFWDCICCDIWLLLFDTTVY